MSCNCINFLGWMQIKLKDLMNLYKEVYCTFLTFVILPAGMSNHLLEFYLAAVWNAFEFWLALCSSDLVLGVLHSLVKFHVHES